jgi:hypothetical protein
MGVRKFSSLIGVNERWLRKIESSMGGMSRGNAIKTKEILETLLKNRKIDKETVIRNFIRFKNFIAFVAGNSTGVKLAERAPLTKDEKKILEILERANINFQVHSTLQLPTGKLINVDFLVEGKENTFVIEVFRIIKVGRSASVRIAEIDHRFRGLKICTPNLKTVMVISSKE